MSKKRYLQDIKKDVIKQIEEFEKGRYILSEEELEKIMPKVVEFYNNHPEDEDIYTDKNGSILLIQTPEPIFNKNGDLVNGLISYESLYGGEKQYLLRDCKFCIYDRVEMIGLFATEDVWRELGDVYNKKAFVKIPNLKLRYKKIGDDSKPMPESKFIEYMNRGRNENELYETIEDIDPAEYFIYYSANISQVIL